MAAIQSPGSLHAAIATNRFGLGARPGELARATEDPQAWLFQQLRVDAVRIEGPGLQSTREVLGDIAELREAAQRDPAKVVAKARTVFAPAYLADAQARFRHATTTDEPFAERLVQFWSNHFAVSVDKIAVFGIAGAFEREAIRPNFNRRFEDLLLAVERHPAMLLYLDNPQSVGPHSQLAQHASAARRKRTPGLNENLAREILELHTLGVQGGYSQADVTSFAAMITGWSIGGGRGRLADGTPGDFVFREAVHEPGAKTLLGKRYAEDGEAQGRAALRDLARHPSTAKHLATKLARHFVADDPPPALVERLAETYLEHEGALVPVYRALCTAPEAYAAPLTKFKTASDYIHSTWRALDLPVQGGRGGLAAFEVLGQRTWSPGSPAGWPDRAADWDGASALLARIEWSDALAGRLGPQRDAREIAAASIGPAMGEATRLAIARAPSTAQALTLWLASPEFMRR